MFIRKNKNNRKKKLYLKSRIFTVKARKNSNDILFNFFKFFKKPNLLKKNNSYSRVINKIANSNSSSLYLNTAMFKKYKNLLQKSKTARSADSKKLVCSNFKKINSASVSSCVSKLLPARASILHKNYFLIKKKWYVNRIAFLNKFLRTPGKKKYKPVFYRFFKFIKNTNKTSTAKKVIYNNSIFKSKNNTNKKKLIFDWAIVFTTTNTNMYVNITTNKGKTIFYHTLRRVGFQTGGGSKRASKVAVERLGIFVGKFLKKKSFLKKKFLIIFKGLSWKKRFILKHIKFLTKKIKIVAIFERTGLAHNGCKLKKRKHKRRSFLKLHRMKRKLKIRRFKNIFKNQYTKRKFLFKKFSKNSPLLKFKRSAKLKFFVAPSFYWLKKSSARSNKLAREVFLKSFKKISVSRAAGVSPIVTIKKNKRPLFFFNNKKSTRVIPIFWYRIFNKKKNVNAIKRKI